MDETPPVSTGLARLTSAVLTGVEATLVTVEVHRGAGLPRETIVGLPGTAVRESFERIHAACASSGLRLSPRRTTVNLAPASQPKSGAGLDLPIALGLLMADGQLPGDRSERSPMLCLGELALDGDVRAVPGALPVALAARRAGARTVLVPTANAPEAAAVPDLSVIPVGSLREAVAHVSGESTLPSLAPIAARRPTDGLPSPAGAADLADVCGQPLARRALEIAAAGGHHLLLSGPPGAGKTLLARALAGVLPDLTFEDALEASAVHSAVGGLIGRGLLRDRPFRAPHHSVTMAGLIGGGAPPRPGEISLAHRGVLFLDELPEFRRPVVEALRQPLEEGRVELVRGGRSVRFPARFQLVAAMNPCPCGRGERDPHCRCGEAEIGRYQRRMSGPILDRIDLFATVPRVPLGELIRSAPNRGDVRESSGGDAPDPESSAIVRARVAAARALQRERHGEGAAAAVVGRPRAYPTPRSDGNRSPSPRLNADIPARDLPVMCALSPQDLVAARNAAELLDLSARAWHRVLRVARTIADLAGDGDVTRAHVDEAFQFRERGAPGA